LLNQADRLAGKGAPPGAPRSVDLRRAISTAYYALFHELVIEATNELVDKNAVKDGGSSLATRWFEHKDIRELADAVAGRGAKHRNVVEVLGRPDPHLVRVAESFVSLQTARHRADYDYNFTVDRSLAFQYVDLARDAVAAARRLEKAREPSYVRFLKPMVGGIRIVKVR
jgi:hypothetical protein